MRLKVEILRPDDLLYLQVEGVNLQLDASDPADPVLVPVYGDRPAYLIYHFTPQTTAEEAFFDPPLQVGKSAGENVAARLGGPSRLVFRVPDNARIPFSTGGLLDWSEFRLQVAPIADVAPNANPPAEALTIRPPTATETALELPYRLILSPTHDVAWDHAREVVMHEGRAELWHTRLASRTAGGGIQRTDEGNQLPLRAIWSPDYNTDGTIPPPGDFGPLGALGAMTPYDRHQIVVLSSAFRGYAANAFWPYTPLPIYASQLMLSALGGWLQSSGMWNPPYKIKPRFNLDLIPVWRNIYRFLGNEPNINDDVVVDVQPHDIEEIQPHAVDHVINVGEHLQPDLHGAVELPLAEAANVAGHVQPDVHEAAELPFAVEAVDVGNVGAFFRPGIHDIVFPFKRYDLGQQLDLSQWKHIASQGRDHYVRIVYEGKLKWSGHRAALIKVTERRFEPDPQTGSPVAYLRQYQYIVVREPEKDYGQEGLANGGRGMPLKKIRLTTLVTPKIDYPYAAPSAITDRSFWVMVGGQDFRFHAVAEDVAGNKIDFTTPLIFVPNSEGKFQQIHDEYVAPKNSQRRAAAVPGQKVTFATEAAGKENTSFATDILSFVNEGTSKADFFKPKLYKADVRIPAVEQLVGANTLSSIRYYGKYLTDDFNPANATGVFAEIVQENAQGVLEKVGSGVEFAANQAGGFATPNLDITNLTRDLGPLGGNVQNALNNQFDPMAIFGNGVAKLFGSFDLKDLIPPLGDMGKDAPKMQVRRDGNTVIAELDWQPAVKDIKLLIVEFHRSNNTKFIVHGVFKKTLGAATNDEFTLTGDLNEFEILLFKVLQINFALFHFRAQSGQKTDVNVKLDNTTPVKFVGDLEFVEGLRKLIPPGVFGDGVSIDLITNPLGVKASLSITLPPAAVGVFALQNISFAAGLTVPFLEGKPIVNFAFARRDNPFILTIAFLGGGGFFGIELDTEGIRMLEAAFEFGATAALNLGVASGEVHIMAGIYFKMEKRMVDRDGVQKELTVSILSGYLRCGGKLSVLGLISVSVEFNLSFTYDSGTQKASGRATLTVTIEIAFFSTSVELTVERSFGAKGGDPTFAQLMDSPAVWSQYAAAFA